MVYKSTDYKSTEEVAALIAALNMPACQLCGRILAAPGAVCVPCSNHAPSVYGSRFVVRQPLPGVGFESLTLGQKGIYSDKISQTLQLMASYRLVLQKVETWLKLDAVERAYHAGVEEMLCRVQAVLLKGGWPICPKCGHEIASDDDQCVCVQASDDAA